MTKYIALLRGINVGGNNIIKMADLKAICAKLGYENVKTYIQSGNVIFDSDKPDATTLGVELTHAIEQSHGFAPQLFMLLKSDVEQALNGLDFEFSEEKFVYFYFLEQPATNANMVELNALLKPDDVLKITDDVVYFHSPEGMGKSKLAAKLDKLLGVKTTARNLRTVKKLIELASL